ncbi:Phytochrome-like protein cph2 [bioreactor metagenome]|uniref:Phytochrome-like protein cph2 n=1 Tax=bioreactor metagenome TaxID=1076179 RepID=A0A645E6P0_9ZZZZ
MKGVASLKALFEQIRSLGIRIAMDDFGTGYSSLDILKNSPADIVKIDKIFIRDILNSSFDATFIRFIVALCHDVGIHVCLEGVENEAEYAVVRSMQLDSIQGYFFGRPVSEKDFALRFLGAT